MGPPKPWVADPCRPHHHARGNDQQPAEQKQDEEQVDRTDRIRKPMLDHGRASSIRGIASQESEGRINALYSQKLTGSPRVSSI